MARLTPFMEALRPPGVSRWPHILFMVSPLSVAAMAVRWHGEFRGKRSILQSPHWESVEAFYLGLARCMSILQLKRRENIHVRPGEQPGQGVGGPLRCMMGDMKPRGQNKPKEERGLRWRLTAWLEVLQVPLAGRSNGNGPSEQ